MTRGRGGSFSPGPAKGCTSFPMPIGMSGSFNRTLIKAMSTAIRVASIGDAGWDEARAVTSAFQNGDVWAPNGTCHFLVVRKVGRVRLCALSSNQLSSWTPGPMFEPKRVPPPFTGPSRGFCLELYRIRFASEHCCS